MDPRRKGKAMGFGFGQLAKDALPYVVGGAVLLALPASVPFVAVAAITIGAIVATKLAIAYGPKLFEGRPVMAHRSPVFGLASAFAGVAAVLGVAAKQL